MKCFRKTRCCIIALVVMSLSLTGCLGGSRGGKSYTVSGEVVDGNGDGIDGVEIVVTGGKNLMTTTDDGGEYAFTGLIDTCTLIPCLDGYTFRPTQITVTKERNNANFIGTAIPVEEFNLVVENGIGGGDFATGVTVPISANAPEEAGKVFDKWISSGGGSFANVNAETTTFTMPNSTVTVTATYRDATMADYFEFDSSTGTITKYNKKGKYGNLNDQYDPEIPSSINGIAVTVIGEAAFQHAQITSVVIPSSVTTIEAWAFNNNLLTTVDIPESVTTMGDYAFTANKLTSIIIPDGISVIPRGAFWLNELTSVTVPDSVTYIGDNAFLSNSLEAITIPNSVTYIGGYAFADNNLTTVVIPDSVITVADNAFGNNYSLTSIQIPDNVFVDRRVFYLDYNTFTVITISIGSNVTLGDNLFGENNNFRDAYEAYGAGTYEKVGDDYTWVM